MSERVYLAIDLKSFYASVECVERGLNPLTTNLVVADKSRTEKTICLAVSPSLKSYGIPGRARLFEVVQRVREVNDERRQRAKNHCLTAKCTNDIQLKLMDNLELDYIIAPPQMALYMEYSTRILNIYLKYICSEDIHVYSIDEVFMDITGYLKTYGMTASELAMTIIRDVLKATGITATAGIGSNLYLCKVAMDIVAKHMPPNKDGVRLAELDEKSYRKLLWAHQPITDFWRVGGGSAKRLERLGLFTMGDVARFSLKYSDYLYKLFGVNAELLIDHAWGYEPCTISDIKSYKPEKNSLSSGQVLTRPYAYDEAKLIVREMADLLALDLVGKRLVTNQLVLTIGYDVENLSEQNKRNVYHGEIKYDRYGRAVPKHSHGTINLSCQTSSGELITDGFTTLFERIANKKLTVRRVTLVAENVIDEDKAVNEQAYEQLDLFTDANRLDVERERQRVRLERETARNRAVVEIRNRFGKNAIIKGMNLQEGATTVLRNRQIGGHSA